MFDRIFEGISEKTHTSFPIEICGEVFGWFSRWNSERNFQGVYETIFEKFSWFFLNESVKDFLIPGGFSK